MGRCGDKSWSKEKEIIALCYSLFKLGFSREPLSGSILLGNFYLNHFTFQRETNWHTMIFNTSGFSSKTS